MAFFDKKETKTTMKIDNSKYVSLFQDTERSTSQCADQESNKVERYNKTNCLIWPFGHLAGSASRCYYCPSMSYLLGFQTKYICDP